MMITIFTIIVITTLGEILIKMFTKKSISQSIHLKCNLNWQRLSLSPSRLPKTSWTKLSKYSPGGRNCPHEINISALKHGPNHYGNCHPAVSGLKTLLLIKTCHACANSNWPPWSLPTQKISQPKWFIVCSSPKQNKVKSNPLIEFFCMRTFAVLLDVLLFGERSSANICDARFTFQSGLITRESLNNYL